MEKETPVENQKELLEGYSYRIPRRITDICLYCNGDAYAQCPRCRIPLDRDYQPYCDRCGQALDWSCWEEL